MAEQRKELSPAAAFASREAWLAIRDCLEGRPTTLCLEPEHLAAVMNGLRQIAARMLLDNVAMGSQWDRHDPACLFEAARLAEEEIMSAEVTMLSQGAEPPPCCPGH
jgi:hypothetical protein